MWYVSSFSKKGGRTLKLCEAFCFTRSRSKSNSVTSTVTSLPGFSSLLEAVLILFDVGFMMFYASNWEKKHPDDSMEMYGIKGMAA